MLWVDITYMTPHSDNVAARDAHCVLLGVVGRNRALCRVERTLGGYA